MVVSRQYNIILFYSARTLFITLCSHPFGNNAPYTVIPFKETSPSTTQNNKERRTQHVQVVAREAIIFNLLKHMIVSNQHIQTTTEQSDHLCIHCSSSLFFFISISISISIVVTECWYAFSG